MIDVERIRIVRFPVLRVVRARALFILGSLNAL